ncbi:peptide chain release factor N(5)-glutamine methyltransferase [Rhizobiales bacterium Sp-1]|uniref:Release factor glutamine methyltransferase n=1 Tax=Segnochrobactrum spirostomi TaxID=2608987 RepID=A0A6A7Y1A8_9HYPH|nr:peptide chain release factor N(5)-glutamine methyltransferase [Segnochrobactrum spirostomi]
MLSVVLADVRARFRAAGLDTPDLDARLLVAEAAGLDPDRIVLGGDRPLDADECARAEALAARRLAGEPVGRILGRREFWGLTFRLSADTLEPRPDTETLVEAALALVRDRQALLRFADVGTGTGAIAVALLTELPNAAALAIDLAPGALATARENAVAAGVGSRFFPAVADFATTLAVGLDFVISNPPYIRTAEIGRLAEEVRRFDPLRALDGGADGLEPYRLIANEAFRALRHDGHLLVEIGWDQEGDVRSILGAAGFVEIGTRFDLGGRARVVSGRRPGSAER